MFMPLFSPPPDQIDKGNPGRKFSLRRPCGKRYERSIQLKISAAHPEEKLGGAQLTQRFYDLQCESRLAEGVILQTNSLQCRPPFPCPLLGAKRTSTEDC
jgi:hypothetical protein